MIGNNCSQSVITVTENILSFNSASLYAVWKTLPTLCRYKSFYMNATDELNHVNTGDLLVHFCDETFTLKFNIKPTRFTSNVCLYISIIFDRFCTDVFTQRQFPIDYCSHVILINTVFPIN